MTWFKSSNQNNITGVSQTLTDRELYIDQNDMKNWATDVVELESGENPTSTQFGNQSTFPLTAAQYQTMSTDGTQPHLPRNRLGKSQFRRLLQPGGHEYDERRRLRSGADLQPPAELDDEVHRFPARRPALRRRYQAKAYQAVRMPVWTTASRPPRTQGVYTNWAGGGSTAIAYVGNFWNSYGYSAGGTSDTGGPSNGPRP
jgi:hypothetical protein